MEIKYGHSKLAKYPAIGKRSLHLEKSLTCIYNLYKHNLKKLFCKYIPRDEIFFSNLKSS